MNDDAPEVQHKRTPMSPDEAQRRLLAGEPLAGLVIDRIVLSGRTFDKPLQINDCSIRTLDLNKCVFQEDVTFRRNRVGSFVANDAVFEKKADFKKNEFRRLRLPRVTFKGDATFASSEANAASLNKCRFEAKSDFTRSSWREDPNFEEVQFIGFATFWFARFAGSFSLRASSFEGGLELRRVDVSDSLNLREARVVGGVDLGEASIGRNLDFAEATLGGKTDFHRLQVGQNLVLLGSKPQEGQGFRFSGLSASRILIARRTVEGHIWHENEGRHLLAAEEYAFLWTTFRQNSLFDDEDWAYLRFKRHERQGQAWTWNPFEGLRRMLAYLLLDVGCGYGTQPFKTFAVCAAIVVVFAGIFYAVLPFDPAAADYHLGSLNHAAFALDMSVTAFSGSYADVPPQFGPHKFLGIVEYLLGVVFIGLFVVAFARQVIR